MIHLPLPSGVPLPELSWQTQVVDPPSLPAWRSAPVRGGWCESRSRSARLFSVTIFLLVQSVQHFRSAEYRHPPKPLP